MCSYQSIHEWQTRLVLIKPNANRSARLELSLVVVDLVDLDTGAVINHNAIVMYDALSYAWGTAPPSVECICDENKILLLENLDSALKHLRQPESERYIWVDFLCINQENPVEKAVQIPRMRNIYSKASTVVIWLGESLKIGNITRNCGKNCQPNLGFLGCSIHKGQIWRSIMDYEWFKRTWVRQEVFASQILEVSSPYFSTTWELFTKELLSMHPPSSTSHIEAVNNLISLNELYSSRSLELLALLKQGKGFQASVPHDHIFSVLGMMTTSKHSTKASIPVTYDKTYHEVCGDVTRYIIRESQSLSILQLCIAQRDRTYAFDWPMVEWLYPISDLVQPQHETNATSGSIEQFEELNPMRKAGTLNESEYTASSSVINQSAPRRPLVLYGRAWGTVTEQLENVLFGNALSVYLIDQGTSMEQKTIDTQHRANYPYPPRPPRGLKRILEFSPSGPYRSYLASDAEKVPYEYPNFLIYKCGLMSHVYGSKRLERKVRVCWECRGSVEKGDTFVALEPGPCNILLRRCSGLDDLFEVVGWGGRMELESEFDLGRDFWGPLQDGDESNYYLCEQEHPLKHGRSWRENHAAGPRQQFNIR